MKIGPLEAIVSGNLKSKKLIIFFHGYGANSEDLFPLSQTTATMSEHTWIFPEAPIDLGSFAGFRSKAWFNINRDLYEECLIKKDFSPLKKRTPEGLEEASKLVDLMIKSLGVDPKSIILGGFSQGAMLALDYILRYEFSPASICLLSTSLISYNRWEKQVKKIQVPFFLSHGKQDATLPYILSTELNQMLKSARRT